MLAGMILMAQLAAPSISFQKAKALADANENGLPATKHIALVQTQDKVLQSAVTACKSPHPDLSAFTVVLVAARRRLGGGELAEGSHGAGAVRAHVIWSFPESPGTGRRRSTPPSRFPSTATEHRARAHAAPMDTAP